MQRWHRIPRDVLFLIMACAVGDAQASWLWSQRTQLTHLAGADSGATAGFVYPGRTDGDVIMHMAVRVWDGDPSIDGRGYYCPLLEGESWSDAWSNRELFTNVDIVNPPNGTKNRASTDHHLLEDGDGDVHLVSEVFYYPDEDPNVVIGYKRRGNTHWTADSLAYVASAEGLYGGSPNLFQEAVGDTLHLNYGRFPTGVMYYTRKALSDPDSSWADEVLATRKLGGANPLLVDGNGQIHFFGRAKSGGTYTVWHVRGTYQSGVDSLTTIDTDLAHWSSALLDPGVDTGDDGAAVMLGSDSLYYAYEALDTATNKIAVFLKVLKLSNYSWSQTPVQVTASDGEDSRAIRFFATANTPPTYHLMYHSPNPTRTLHGWTTADTTRIYHMYNSGDPLNPADWSSPTEVARDRRTTSQRPAFVARGDTVWVAYASHDDDESSPIDDHWQAWAEKGWRVDGTTAEDNETWSGIVYLDEDYVVVEGDTLTIEPGTQVFAAASVDTAIVRLIVLGELQANGTEGNPIRFASYGGSGGSGDWGGIDFEVADASGSRLEYAEIGNATVGVWCDAIAPSLSHIEFSDNRDADIFLSRDVRIAAGSEWNLDAPTRVVATDYPAGEDSLGTDGYTDLIVPGSLVTQRPGTAASTDSVVFESLAKDSSAADDWAGITIAAGGTGLLHDCDIGFGLRGVYFAAADSAELVNSHVHHYSEEGVFDYASDALIQGCSIGRDDVDEEVETTGVHAKASVPEIRDNAIGWQNVYGTWLQFGKSFCRDLPWGPTDTLRVIDNTITGNGTSNLNGSAGIRAEYLCQNHATLIDHNTVTNWRGRAIDLYETADVHVSCNAFDGNYAGAQFSRKDWLQSSEEDVFWKGNSLRRNVSDNLKILYETGLQLYDAAGSGAAAGQNTLQKYNVPEAKNIRMAGGSFEPLVDARHQAWLDANDTAIMDSTTIQATNVVIPAGDIKVGSFLSADESCGGGGVSAQRGGRSVVVESTREGTAGPLMAAGVPGRWSLTAGGSNPTSGAVLWVLAAPVPSAVRLAVYDVRGRLVRRIGEGPVTAGYHEWRWDRSTEDGGTATSGVYFLRVESPGFRQTRKVVLLPAGR